MKTLILLLLAAPVFADEGMWTYNNFPKDAVKKAYNFTPDDKWLEHAQLSSARLAGGCSGSFVSENGLVLTNHHCAHECIAQLSTAEKDFVKSGFYAKTQAEEVKCPEMEINELVGIEDVTAKIQTATKGLEGDKFAAALKAAEAAAEKACATSDKVRCDVVTLYHGGKYNLYKYRRFQDVRLVFAPELSIAFFGGDPDNFNFPRYDLDMSMVRVYDDGKPAKMDHYFKWSSGGVKPGDPTFVSGHPGGTDRQLTVAQLEYQRDYQLPERLLYMAEIRGLFTQFAKESAEHKRIITDDLFSIENGYKVYVGRLQALTDPKLLDQKRAEEKKLRDALAKKKDKKSLAAFDQIAKAVAALKQMRKQLLYIESDSPSRTWRQSLGFESDLMHYARVLVRAADERQKPDEKRTDEYRESKTPQMTQRLFVKKPIYDDKEILTLTYSLTKLREILGADDPFVKQVLGAESPSELATRLVKGSKLKDIAVRKQLWDGGKKAIEASDDPLIKLAREIEPTARALRQQYDDNVDAPYNKGGEILAAAHFAVEGTKSYPDATFTLRLNFGQVKGWNENGKYVDPITDFGGAFNRATGRAPFDLPPSWIAAKPKLDLKTPLNFCSTNDIIGGNSGSPVINKAGELVGLIFDGNIESLGGDYGYDQSVNRAVAVHSEGILHALTRIYGADRVVEELRPNKSATR
jgi:V8-like Glu-specific endopeptidase